MKDYSIKIVDGHHIVDMKPNVNPKIKELADLTAQISKGIESYREGMQRSLREISRSINERRKL